MALMQNSGRPSGALVADDSLDDEQYERLRAQIQREDVGATNAGRAMLFEGGLKWIQMSMKPTDIDWFNGLNLSSRQIEIVLRTPPELIFDSTNKVFASYREARKAYYDQTIMPDAQLLRDALNEWLGPYFRNFALDYDLDAIDALQEDRAALWASVRDAWVLTLNEKRRMLGLSSLGPDGDVLMLPASYIAVTPDQISALSNNILGSVGQVLEGATGGQAPQNNARVKANPPSA